MKKYPNSLIIILAVLVCSSAQMTFTQDVTITVSASDGKRAVSPYIYGRNNTFDKPAQFYKDAGLRMARMNGGNNATRYNWRKKITVHPDWYNNVYAINWDATSQKIVKDHPDMQAMWAFQLIGNVASRTNSNFNDWSFNSSKYWQGVGQNLAGGGVPNTANPSGKALVEGDPSLYTMEWPADSTVEILNHWFGPDGLGLNKNQFLYWNMDNEADIWNGTHDDVMKTLISASEFMDRYIDIAKKAKAIFPEIKICGPVTTSEWQWFKWGDESIYLNRKYYCWLEYFIKRLADEEKASGVRLLDVVDLHNYPYAKNGDIDALQLHRMYYETNYIYPGANGIKTINGGWDNSQTKEYIFKRINDWLDLHYVGNHGIKCGLSEWSPATSEPNATAVVYASHLGTFANRGVEYFTPWTWYNGMWETMHLFSRYAKNYSISSVSSLENTVSAYSTINEIADSMTVIIVNRDMSASRNVTVNLNDFPVYNGSYKTLQLSSLPANETFVSHTNNALKTNSVLVKSNSFTISVPKLSTTAVILKSTPVGIEKNKDLSDEIKIYPNPATDNLLINIASNVPESMQITIFDQLGRIIRTSNLNYDGNSTINLDVSALQNGVYMVSVQNINSRFVKNFKVFK